MKEYKVITEKVKLLNGNFDPAKLANTINVYADQGWVLKSAFSIKIPIAFGATREEAILILERDK